MNNWTKLTNNEFDDFTIEDIDSSFYLPTIYINKFKEFIEENSVDMDEKLDRLNNLINSPIDDISSLSTMVSNLLNETIDIKNFTYLKFNSSEDNTKLLTGADDDRNEILKAIEDNYGYLNVNEYIVAYHSTNILGSFKGTILTNQKLVGIGGDAFIINISEIKSIKNKLFSRSINGSNKIYCSETMINLIKNLIGMRCIPFCMVIKHGDGSYFSSKKGRILFSREKT